MANPDARVRIIAVPAHHAHDPSLDDELGKGNGYVFQWDRGDAHGVIYWTGDAVVTGDMATLRERYGTIDVLLADMGAVGSDGPLGRRSLDAEEALALMRVVQPTLLVPIHHTTFGHYREPIEALTQQAAAAGMSGRLRVLGEGEGVSFP